ncbi:MAG TPA: Holliday junction branch migration DNA helicase RuvB [Tepidisphaeraceae bacterium]|jgi:Holliday junction DNA helicase RuvB|nr:Holliday junction branch migration DNA helicase RuvB [Tepidisphaeraceae bacterium]
MAIPWLCGNNGMARERIVSGESGSEEENRFNFALRPKNFLQYIGQETLIRRLKIAVSAAKGRKEPVEHVLLHGPPGLGKTTLAHVIANEMAAQVHVTSGPALTKGADLVGILTKLGQGDVLFIDEIHRLPAVVEEYLYSAMEDFKVDITLDAGMHARTITMPLPPFTLIGATTRIGLLTGPMRSRFGISNHIEFYTPEALHEILRHNAKLLTMDFEDSALGELARRSRGTPRIANRLLRRVRDYAAVEATGKLTISVTQAALKLEGIDQRGLDEQDRAYLRTLIDVYEGGPAGVEAIAASLGEEIDTLVDVVEPYQLQTGLVLRTRQGRRATKNAYEHLGIKYTPPRAAAGEPDGQLFGQEPGEPQ